MKLCRFQADAAPPRPGILIEDDVVDLSAAGYLSLSELLETSDRVARVSELSRRNLPRFPRNEVRLLCPVERQEIWAAGVTYLRSRTARMEESSFSAQAYQHVYEAPRPELFFKSVADKVSGPDQPVGIRRDASWNVPEPELALVFNPRGELVAYTIGNDMSSRDIEGENLLYLPQAKVYQHSCALGPCLLLGATEADARSWTIHIDILRQDQPVFTGVTSVGRLKRLFGELGEWLFRSQQFPHGVVLLTGTGIVPPDDFTLQAGDWVRIHIDGVGTLSNPVIQV